jgi:hypothetical protein
MRFQSGKHPGKTTEEVLLKFPDWAFWNVNNYPDSKHSKEFETLGRKFAAKPFTKRCHGGCGKLATRGTAYAGSPNLMFWCNNCSPTQRGASGSKLTVVRTFDDVIRHIGHTANGNRAYSRNIVRQLAEAKGLPKRVGEKHALAFFS